MASLGVVFRNTGFIFCAELLSRVLFFLLVFAIARVLGDSGLGEYSFVFAFVGLFVVFNDFGLSIFITREVARSHEKASEYFSSVLSLKVIISLAAALASVIAATFIDGSGSVRVSIYLAAFAMFFLALKEFFMAVFIAFERMFLVALLHSAEILFIVIFGIFAILGGYGIIGLTSVFLVVYFLAFVVAFFAARRLVTFTLSFNSAVWWKFLKQSMPFWLTTVFIAIYFRIDTVMVGIMRGFAETGLYNAAYRLLDALYFIPNAVIVAVFPAMSRLHITNPGVLTSLYRKAFTYLLILALPMGVGATLLAHRIMLFIYSGSFSANLVGSALALQILIWAEVAIFLSSLSGHMLNAINRQLLFTFTTAAAAVLNVVLNLFFIQRYGFIGAAITTVITEFLVLVALFYFVRKSGHSISVFRAVIKPLAAVAVMAPFVFLLLRFHILVIVPVAAAVYFIALLLLRGVEKEELAIIRSFLGRLKLVKLP